LESRIQVSWSDADLAFRDQVRAFPAAELTAEMRRDVRRIDQRLLRLRAARRV
jgi:hypothetical protein